MNAPSNTPTVGFEPSPWSDEMERLKEALVDRGVAVPAGYRLDLVTVADEERDATGRFLFRIAYVPVLGAADLDSDDMTFAENAKEVSS